MLPTGKAVRKVTAYSITTLDVADIYEAIGGVTITLPPVALSYGRTIAVKKIDVPGVVTIDGFSSDTIDDNANQTIQNQYSYMIFYAASQTPNNWIILAANELSGTMYGWDGVVLNYAALPPAADHTGEYWMVQEAQGSIPLLTQKNAGIYYSNGVSWKLQNNYNPYYSDGNFRIFNTIDDTKKIATDASAITTGTTRTLSMADSDVDLADIGTNANDITALENLNAVMSEPTGFENRTDTTISFTDLTLTFEIAPVAATFDFYIKGVKWTKTGAQTKVITDTEGLWYFYYDATGTLQATQTFSNALILENALISIIYWDAANNTAIYLGDERHGLSMDGATHLNLHTTQGTKYVSGLALGNIVPDGTGNNATDAELSTANGSITDEDIVISITGQALPANLAIYYRDGAGGNWRKTAANDYPCKPFVGGSNRLAWNENITGTWQQTEISNADFVLSHIFATNDLNDPIIVIQGQADYGTLTQARNGANDEINNLITAGLPFVEFTAIGTVIFQTSTGYSNAVQARIRSTDTGDDYVDWRTSDITPTTGPTSHTDLTGRDAVNQHPASSVNTDTANFDENLSTSEIEVQSALEIFNKYLPSYYLQGLNVNSNTTNPTYQIDIAIGKCRNYDNDDNIVVSSPITVDITTAGANGLDTGAEAASTWYYVYVIYNPTTDTTSGLLSISSTTPTLPAGYTKKRRVGAIRNNSSSNFYRQISYGEYNKKNIYYQEDRVSSLTVLNGGTATTFTDVLLTDLVPITSELSRIMTLTSQNGISDFTYIRPDGWAFGVYGVISSHYFSEVDSIMPCPNQTIEYQCVGAGCACLIYLLGYIEEL